MRARYIIGTGLILGALVVVSVVTYSREAVAYFTVDELYEQAGEQAFALGPAALAASPLAERSLQVRGEVDVATVDRGEDGLQMRFELTGKDGRLPVVYRGLVPDTFDQAESVTVGGRLDSDGAMAADELFVQCPSKYEAVPPSAADGAADAYGGAEQPAGVDAASLDALSPQNFDASDAATSDEG